MEAIADKLRKQCCGRGIHFFVFVDDWLVVGDDEALTLEGCSMLEDELRLLGISWAPNKHRGPLRSWSSWASCSRTLEGCRASR